MLRKICSVHRALAVATALLLSSPWAASATSPGDALRAADGQLNKAALDRDREAFKRLLDPEVTFLAGEPQRGRVAVLAMWQHLFDGKFDFRYEAETLETAVAESGELGWTIGTVRTSFTRPGLDTESVIEGHYLNVWTRGEGSWRVAHMTSLVVHPTWGAARDPRSGLMTAWPELADQVGAKIDLEWTPTSTVRSSSGELAVTVGDYRASFERDGEEVSGGGAFLSVWRRDAGGHWQLAGEGFTPPDIYAESAATDASTSPGSTP